MRQVEEAEIAKFTPQEQREYEASKMAYRDINPHCSYPLCNSLISNIRIFRSQVWV